MVVIVVVIVVVVMAPMRRDYDVRPPGVAVMVMMMVVLRELDARLHRSGRPVFVKRLQERPCILDRLQEIGIGTGVQHVGRIWSRRSLDRTNRSERRHRSDYSGNLLFQSRSPMDSPTNGICTCVRWLAQPLTG